MARYLHRVIDDELDDIFSHRGGLPAIALEGPRAVGKSETAYRRAGTIFQLDDPDEVEILRADPQRLVNGKKPIVIDEWQRFPRSWDLVRRAVDRDGSGGQFILTGSSAPIIQPTHSGAGRIVTLRMRPLSFFERALSTPTVSLRQLLQGTRPPIEGSSPLNLTDYVREITSSGFPAIRSLSPQVRGLELDGYIDRIVEHDFLELGRSVRNKNALRRWMLATAASVSSNASFEVIRDAASGGKDEKPSKVTTIAYRRILEQLWILDDVPSWLPTHNRLSRLGVAPKHQLADPALALQLLGVGEDGLLSNKDLAIATPRDGSLLGAMFESLTVQSLRVYAQASQARVSHMRTHSGHHEVDAIVERTDGRIVAFEIKLAQVPQDRDVRHLKWLEDQIGGDLLDSVILTTGREAFRRMDGIAVIPLSLLGP